MAKRELTPWAHAAKLIRQELKKNGIQAKVCSKSYAGGCSVDVYLNNELPATVEKVEEFVGQFQYGSFDGMIDLYEYTNTRDDIPQVKYAFVSNRWSDDWKQAAWDWIRKTFADVPEDAEEDFKQAHKYHVMDSWGDQIIHRALSGGKYTQICRMFWQAHKPRERVAA